MADVAVRRRALEHADYCDCGRQYVGGVANTADSECPALTCGACPRAGCICPPCECLACRQRHRKAMTHHTPVRSRAQTPIRERLFDPEPDPIRARARQRAPS